MRLFQHMALALALCLAAPAVACDRQTPCPVAEGEYFIALPEGATGPIPAIVWVQGWGSTGDGIFRMRGLVETILGRGYALVSPNGVPRQGRSGRSWGFRPDSPGPRDEVAFLASVKDDAISRHGLDPDRILLAGFSIGGSMTAYSACAAPGNFAAYAPIGGNFWRPHPTECAGPVRMLHTHGWTDGTVPLEGRVLRGDSLKNPNALVQGDIFHAMLLWRATNDCMPRADQFVTDGPFWRRSWTRCTEGSALELALFPGGHSIPNGWATLALDWFEGLDARN